MAYELELSENNRIHNVFHVSCLKNALGQGVTISEELFPLNDEGKLALEPDEIVDKEM